MERVNERGEPAGNVRLLLETLYALAAHPDLWEQLISALEPDRATENPPERVAAELGGIHKIMALARRTGEGPPDGSAKEVGLIVLSPNTTVLACCDLAKAVLEPSLGAASLGAKLQLHDPDNDEALKRAMGETKRSGRQAILRLERPTGAAPAFCFVAETSALAGVSSRESSAYALMFPAPGAADQLWDSIGKSFGLTSAELRLAAKLREGLSLSEAADELGVSVNTVRNQLRAVFDKMGLRRQSDLVRALTELASIGNALVATSSKTLKTAPPIRKALLKDGRLLAFREYGPRTGRPVVVFHGGMSSSLMPAGSADLAESLNLHLICPERPGYGQSDRHSGCSFESVAGDMEQLCDQLGLVRPALCGVVSGATYALATAKRLGDRVTGVFSLAGRPPRRLGREPSPLSELRTRFESHPWVVETFYSILRMRLSPDLARRLLKRLASYSEADGAYFNDNPEITDFVFAYVTECLAHGGRGIADEMAAFRHGRNMTLEGVTSPVVVWHGAEDRFSPLEDVLAFVGDHASEVRRLDGIGHLAPFRHWRDIMRRIAIAPDQTS